MFPSSNYKLAILHKIAGIQKGDLLSLLYFSHADVHTQWCNREFQYPSLQKWMGLRGKCPLACLTLGVTGTSDFDPFLFTLVRLRAGKFQNAKTGLGYLIRLCPPPCNITFWVTYQKVKEKNTYPCYCCTQILLQGNAF